MLYLTSCFIIESLQPNRVQPGTIVTKERKIEEILDDLLPGQIEGDVIDFQKKYILPDFWNTYSHPGGMIPDPTHQSMFELPLKELSESATMLEMCCHVVMGHMSK